MNGKRGTHDRDDSTQPKKVIKYTNIGVNNSINVLKMSSINQKRSVPKPKKNNTSSTGVTANGTMGVGVRITNIRSLGKSTYIFSVGGKVLCGGKTYYYEKNDKSTPVVYDESTLKQISGPKPVAFEDFENWEIDFILPSRTSNRENYAQGSMVSSDKNTLTVAHNATTQSNSKPCRYSKVIDITEVEEQQQVKREEVKPSFVPKIYYPIQTKEEETENGDCSICMSRKIATVFVPCGHATMCNTCCRDYVQRNMKKLYCPKCTRESDGAITLYIE